MGTVHITGNCWITSWLKWVIVLGAASIGGDLKSFGKKRDLKFEKTGALRQNLHYYVSSVLNRF